MTRALTRTAGGLCLLAAAALTATAQPELEWSQTYGGPELNFAEGGLRTNDGGFLMAGFSTLNETENHWSVKTDADGAVEWETHHPVQYPGGVTEPSSSFIGVFEAGDGYILFIERVGEDWGGDFIAVPLSAEGDIGEYTLILDNQNYVEPYYYSVTAVDGGYLVTGRVGEPAGFWVFKLDSDFELVWAETYSFFGFYYAEVDDAVEVTGGYAVIGNFVTFDANEDAMLMMIQSDGELLWSESYGDETLIEDPYTLIQTSDGKFVIGGAQTPDWDEGASFYVLKTDSEGNLEWEDTYDAPEDFAECWSILEDPSGNLILDGGTANADEDPLSADILLKKVTAAGDQVWSTTFGEPDVVDFAGGVFPSLADGSVYLAGATGTFENLDGWLAKTTPDVLGVDETGGISVPETPLLLDAYPNPFNAGARVTVTTARAGMIDVSVYDLLGRSVLTIVRGDVPAGTHVYSFDGSQFGSGVYFVRAEAPGAAATTAKLTLVR